MDRELRLMLSVKGGYFEVIIFDKETREWCVLYDKFDIDEGDLGLWLSDEIGSRLNIMREQEEEEND